MTPNHLAIRMVSNRTKRTYIALIPRVWLAPASFCDCYRIAKTILREPEHNTADLIELCKFIRTAQREIPNLPTQQ